MQQRILTFACGFVAAMLASCGGGGGGGSVEPRSLSEAVVLQSQAGVKLQGLFEELIIEENAANTALDEERYADFDNYWQQDYPDWVDRLSKITDQFMTSEDWIQQFLPPPEGKAADTGSPKFVPLGIVLAATATVTLIAIQERARLAALDTPVPADEKEDLIDARARYLRQEQGLNATQARTRAIADIGKVETLRGLKNGIEHARQFALTNLRSFFVSYLPQQVQSVISLDDTAGEIDQIRQNATVLLSDTACEPVQEKAHHARAKIEEFPTCRIIFCDPSELQCKDVPDGTWGTAVLSETFVRDEPRVTISNGVPATAILTLLTPDDVLNPVTPTPSATPTPAVTPTPSATPTATAQPTASPTPTATPTPEPSPTATPTPVTNFQGFWAGASCSSGPARYEITLNQEGTQVNGSITFHNCPGGGRAGYTVSGTATSATTITLSGPRTSTQGDASGLAGTTPAQGTFIVSRNSPPSPNYAP